MKVLAKTPGLYQVAKLRNATTTTSTTTTTTTISYGGRNLKEDKQHLTDVMYYY